MSASRYASEAIKQHVLADIERLFAPWAVGRLENWVPDPATKELIALGYWLNEELKRICVTADDQRTQCFKYNRLSRTYDIWHVATECLNDVLDGNVERNRQGHRRWG